MRSANQIRREFIEFFRQRGHMAVPSAPVVPAGDPTLLFINAGMNQFKDVFLGTGSRDYNRAVNAQKCIRVSGKHNDLEEVGRDTYHHTFFEMLGNWSFGDYGKRESIGWAWELMTGVWKLPKERLFATVHLEDDEAEALWKSETDIDPSHISRFDKDNFWEMGEVGPCGPSSEIHIDLGETPGGALPAADPLNGINTGNSRYIELWNLVFIRFERMADGSLVPLGKSHVDTGMGFERICAVLQGKKSNFDIDVFAPILERISEISGKSYDPGEAGTAHRVIADHVRMLTFSLTDGAIPSNEGRGYVVRRILRRAARFGRELGVKEPFIHALVPVVVETLGEAYPEIIERQEHVMQVIRAEEESFGLTLDRGLELFDQAARRVLKSGDKTVPGEEAFKLYDTFGFPLDLTVLMARERGLSVDEEEFRAHMDRRRKQSRADSRFGVKGDPSRWARELGEDAATVFTGYLEIESGAVVLGADENALVLDRTPFYAESGGQVADTGVVRGEGFAFRVDAVRKAGRLVVHEGEFIEGGVSEAAKGSRVTAAVENPRRRATARNHTATHILHRVLRDTLGGGATQAGSLVDPDYLRFDFNHYSRLDEPTLREIEKKVNAAILENRPVKTRETDYDSAIREGVTALFGEKYESRVRVVEVEGFSRELCGGTHVSATGEIGPFVITAESSVAAGVRRIEALTGETALEYLMDRSHTLNTMIKEYQVSLDESLHWVNDLVNKVETLMGELSKCRLDNLKNQFNSWMENNAESLPAGEKVLTKVFKDISSEELKMMGDWFREKCKSGVALFAAINDGKVLLVCSVTDDLVSSGRLKAGELVGQVARIAGGGGGGKPHLATAGGKQPEKLPEALEAFKRLVKEKLSS